MPYIVEISHEILTEYEMSRRTPETYVKGVTGIKRGGMYVYGDNISKNVDCFGDQMEPMQIVCEFEIGKDFNYHQTKAILERGTELGLSLLVVSEDEAKEVISANPDAGKIEACRLRQNAQSWFDNDGDETPFTR